MRILPARRYGYTTARCMYAMTACPSVCLSICPPQVGVLSKPRRMNKLRWFNSACGFPRLILHCVITSISAVANKKNARRNRAVDMLMITVINYSDRASELGGIVNLFDRQRSSLSRSGHPPCRVYSITRFNNRYAEARPEYATKSRGKYPYF